MSQSLRATESRATRNHYRSVQLLGGVLLPGLLLAVSASPAESGTPEERRLLALRITASGWLTSATGTLQTPRGGGAGTTSPGRPTLEEIGLDGLEVLPIVDAQLRVLEAHELHLNFFSLKLEGTEILESALISQGVPFPAAAPVASRLSMSFVRIGYRAHWLPLSWGGWTLAPEFGVGYFDFHYELSSPAAMASVDRSYGVVFPYLGFELDGELAKRLKLEIEVLAMGGINGVSYVDTDVRLLFDLLPNARVRTSLMLGLRGTLLGRRDSQNPVPNDIEIKIGSFSSSPWAGLTFGLRIDL